MFLVRRDQCPHTEAGRDEHAHADDKDLLVSMSSFNHWTAWRVVASPPPWFGPRSYGAPSSCITVIVERRSNTLTCTRGPHTRGCARPVVLR